ncbi:hypothetical protein [Lactococcus formosensis]|uniref:hypothetical protein n=1 Tax=Lactococcus formosensis TaxID=1281486 RepID=UPI001BCEBEC8|nr:hypothetical protein [Lactococcus formosensis]
MRTYKGLKEWNKYQPSTDKSSNVVSGTQTELKQKSYCSPYLLVKSSPKHQGSLLAKRILKEESDKRNGSQNKDTKSPYTSLLAVIVILVMYLIMFGLLTIRLRLV